MVVICEVSQHLDVKFWSSGSTVRQVIPHLTTPPLPTSVEFPKG